MNVSTVSFLVITRLVFSVIFFNIALKAEDTFVLNEKKVPESIEDYLLIEKTLQSHLPLVRKATVSITDGKGFGSGVIVSPDGIIMTAAHVVAGVNKNLTIIMEDGTEHKAISLGLDSNSDAALVKILGDQTWDYVEVEKKSKKKMTTDLGDWVFGLGHSGGFDVERGSAVRLGRIVRLADSPATFQSDCKLIGGDSGGPLFNMNGILIAIHSRVGHVLDQNNHVASYDFFAIIDGVSKWDRMLEGEFLGEGPFAKKPTPGNAFIGIELQESQKGLSITYIEEASPAATVALQINDILLSVEGNKVKTKAELSKIMQTKSEGNKIKIQILRETKEQEFELILTGR